MQKRDFGPSLSNCKIRCLKRWTTRVVNMEERFVDLEVGEGLGIGSRGCGGRGMEKFK